MNIHQRLMLERFESKLNESADLEGYQVNKINEKKFEVKKPNGESYFLTKNDSNWECTCTGFKYRHKCKHMDLIRQFLPVGPKRHKRETIEQAIKDVMPYLKKITPNVEVVGSYRRGRADSKDIDILIDCSDSKWEQVKNWVKEQPNYEPPRDGLKADGGNIFRGFLSGIELDINHVVKGNNYPLMLVYRTGPKDFNLATRILAKQHQGTMSENELTLDGKNYMPKTEKDVFDALGIEYIPPEKRDSIKRVSDFKPLRGRSDVGTYKVVVGSKIIGEAPGRKQSHDYVIKFRELMNRIEKEFNDKGKEFGETLKITCPEKPKGPIPVKKKKFKFINPNGDEVEAMQYRIEIKFNVKRGSKKVDLNDYSLFWEKYGHKDLTYYQMLCNVVQVAINKEMKLKGDNQFYKLVQPKIEVSGEPVYAEFYTLPFVFDSVR